MNISTMTSNGRIVIPAIIRKNYALKKGTKLCFIEINGRIIVQPFTKGCFSLLEGVLSKKGTCFKDCSKKKERNM